MALTRLTSANAIPDDSIANVKMANIVQSKNIVINGDMSVAQRATSTASITSAGFQTVDRFYTGVTTAGTWTQSQDTDVPSGQGFATSLKMDCTTADGSLAAGDLVQLVQYIEGQNVQYLKWGTSSAQSLTLSFWVKSVKTGTYIAELRNSDNTRTIAKSYTVDSASTWEKKTITFVGDTDSGPNNDNGEGLRLTLWLAAGSTYTSGTLATSWEATTQANRAVGQVNLADSTSNDFWITGIQLETGDTASEFEFLPYGVNLRRCQRYFYMRADGRLESTSPSVLTAGLYANNFFYAAVQFPVQMRAAPTLYQASGSNLWSYWRHSSSVNFDSFDIANANRINCRINNNAGTLGTQDYTGWCAGNATASCFLGFTAEL